METRNCAITNEEIIDGYFIESTGDWIADKENLVNYLLKTDKESIEADLKENGKKLSDFDNYDDLLDLLHEYGYYFWTTVD